MKMGAKALREGETPLLGIVEIRCFTEVDEASGKPKETQTDTDIDFQVVSHTLPKVACR